MADHLERGIGKFSGLGFWVYVAADGTREWVEGLHTLVDNGLPKQRSVSGRNI